MNTWFYLTLPTITHLLIGSRMRGRRCGRANHLVGESFFEWIVETWPAADPSDRTEEGANSFNRTDTAPTRMQ